MNLSFTVEFPKGFLDSRSQNDTYSKYAFSKEIVDKYFSNVHAQQQIILSEYINFTLEELISNFHKINNIYKSNPEQSLFINEISKFITTEDSLIKNVLPKIEGRKGRYVISKQIYCVYSPNKFVSYNPILKDTRKNLLILFNIFSKCKKEDIIMYENKPLFIYLFAIIIDCLHVTNPNDLNKKNCTDVFPMITLLELLLNKKYKHVLESSINKIKDNEIADSNLDDNEWDNDNFNPCAYLPSNIIISPITPIETKNDDIPNNISKIPDETPNNISKISDETPDNWDTI